MASESSAVTSSPAAAGTAAGAPGTTGPPRRSTLYDSVVAPRWSTRGVTKVVGSVEIGQGSLEGWVVVGQKLSAEHLVVRGTLEVLGPLSVRGDLSVHGSLRAGSTAKVGDAALTGTVRCDGPLEVERRLVARGSLLLPTLRAGEAHLAGLVKVADELRAGVVDAELADGSEIGRLLARRVQVTGPYGGFVDRLLGRSRSATIDRIEGETIELERVEVRTVVGRKVVLRRDCHVDTLDAASVQAHPTSRIGPESRSPPPPGLRR